MTGGLSRDDFWGRGAQVQKITGTQTQPCIREEFDADAQWKAAVAHETERGATVSQAAAASARPDRRHSPGSV